MTLRARLILLIVGSAIIPPLVLALAVVVSVLDSGPEGPAGYLLIRQLTRPQNNATVQSVLDQLDSVPDTAPVYVVDGSDTARYPDSVSGRPADIDSFINNMDVGREWSSSVLPLPDDDGGTGYILVLFPHRDFPVGFSVLGLIVPLGFVIFTGIGSMFIARSINSSIAKLEGATRRIAGGDLDFRLEASGRDRLASLTRSFESMRIQLKEQFDRGSRFLMGISHDLKTPLSSITGYVDAITDGYADSPEKLAKYTSIIRTKTQLLESRISALIDYAKQETRDWKKTLQPVSLAAFLTELTSLVEAEAHARRFTFAGTIDLPDDLLVDMDPDMVNRAFENLVENAFLYADPESRIELRARSAEQQVTVEIVNAGPGINAHDLPHIFDPLYRAAADRPSTGFGLGLATVRSVIASHGWRISVESDPGTTTVFTVVIPIENAPSGV